MERIIDLDKYQPREQVNLARPPLPVKPFTIQQITTVETTFKSNNDLSHWCGYTFLENIPPSLENEISPISIGEPIGVVLFLNTPEHLHVLIQDTRNHFHLMTKTGQTVSVKGSLEEILHSVSRKKN